MLSNKKLKLFVFLFIFYFSASFDFSEEKMIEKEEFLDGIIAVINSDIITLKDVRLELLIQNKLFDKNIDVDNILNRIIEDKLILQDISKYSASYFSNFDIDIEKEFSQLLLLYNTEENFKKILRKIGLTNNDVSIKLKEKKLIYTFLNYRLYQAITKNEETLSNFSKNSQESNFEIKKILAEKSQKAYIEYINSLKKENNIVIKMPIDFIKKIIQGF